MEAAAKKKIGLWILSRVALLVSVVGVIAAVCGLPSKGSSDLPMAVLGLIVAFAASVVFVKAQRKRGLPISELVLTSVVFGVLTLITAPVFKSANIAASKTRCLSNVKEIARANLAYASDFDDHLPLVANWQTATDRYRHGFPQCRVAESKVTYGFNTAASGLSLEETSDIAAVMIFEMDSAASNAHGNASDLVIRHYRPLVAKFDGSAQTVQLGSLSWDPKAKGR